MMSFGNMKGVADKVKIVVNRVGLDNGNISLKKAQDTIGREIFWQLPNDYRTMVEVRNNGVPLVEQAPKAAITQAVVNLANALSGSAAPGETEEDATKSGVRSLLNFWPGKGKDKGAKPPAPAK
jgi:pilus assembly protein CpaE